MSFTLCEANSILQVKSGWGELVLNRIFGKEVQEWGKIELHCCFTRIYKTYYLHQSVCSVAQSCPTLCDPMDCSTPGWPFHHQLPEFAQTHIHWVNDVIQPSHPLLSASPAAFNLSHHHGLFQWVSSLHQVAKVLELQLQHQSFQWIFRTDFLLDWLVWCLYCPGDSQESSLTPQFKSINSSALSFLSGPTLISIHDCWKNHSFD